MKKVIGAVVAASLVAGVAFADVAVKLNAKLATSMYHSVKPDGGDTQTTTFDLNGANGHGGSGANAECVTFEASGENAGAVLAIKATNDAGKTQYYVNGDKLQKLKSGSTTEYEDAEISTADLKIDNKYYGWMKFGALNLTFGKFDSRFAQRYNTTAGSDGLLDSDSIAKYGNALLKVNKKDALTLDANNISTIGNAKVVSLVADYTVDAGDGKLLLKAGLLSNEYKKETNSTQAAGYVFSGAYQSEPVDIEAFVKLPKEKQTIFGAYVAPKVMAELPLAFGFTYGKDDNDGNTKGTAYAVDARVGYVINDQAKISSVIKYESVKPDSGSDDTALVVAVEGSYIVNDLATVFADVGYYNYDLDSGNAVKDKCVIKFRPGVVLNAGKSASITAALQYDNWTKTSAGETKTEMSIPVIFKVAL